MRADDIQEASRFEPRRPSAPRLGAGFPFRPVADTGGPNATASLFLSLLLLVLAFFIVMVSISTLDAKRSADVIGSVAKAFAPDVLRAPVAEGAQRGDVVDGEDLEQSLKGLFATELAVAEFRSVVPGRVLEVAMAAAVLFHPEHSRLRLSRARLLDRLVATVTLRPEGQLVDVQTLISTRIRTPHGSALPTSPSALAVRRAGALGEALTGRGLPRSRLALGLQPGEDDRIVLTFTIITARGGSGLGPVAAGAAPGMQ